MTTGAGATGVIATRIDAEGRVAADTLAFNAKAPTDGTTCDIAGTVAAGTAGTPGDAAPGVRGAESGVAMATRSGEIGRAHV